MLWIQGLHVVFVVTWFAGLFYLPRILRLLRAGRGRHNKDDARRDGAKAL